MSRAKDIRGSVGDPAKLAQEIRRVLDTYGRGHNDRLLPVIDFYEGELKLIEYALRTMADHRRAAKKPAESTD